MVARCVEMEVGVRTVLAAHCEERLLEFLVLLTDAPLGEHGTRLRRRRESSVGRAGDGRGEVGILGAGRAPVAAGRVDGNGPKRADLRSRIGCRPGVVLEHTFAPDAVVRLLAVRGVLEKRLHLGFGGIVQLRVERAGERTDGGEYVRMTR